MPQLICALLSLFGRLVLIGGFVDCVDGWGFRSAADVDVGQQVHSMMRSLVIPCCSSDTANGLIQLMSEDVRDKK